MMPIHPDTSEGIQLSCLMVLTVHVSNCLSINLVLMKLGVIVANEQQYVESEQLTSRSHDILRQVSSMSADMADSECLHNGQCQPSIPGQGTVDCNCSLVEFECAVYNTVKAV